MDLACDADVAHLSPARYAHLNPYGKYRFNVDEEFHAKDFAR
jgi:rRNA maturation protein Nop10